MQLFLQGENTLFRTLQAPLRFRPQSFQRPDAERSAGASVQRELACPQRAQLRFPLLQGTAQRLVALRVLRTAHLRFLHPRLRQPQGQGVPCVFFHQLPKVLAAGLLCRFHLTALPQRGGKPVDDLVHPARKAAEASLRRG